MLLDPETKKMVLRTFASELAEIEKYLKQTVPEGFRDVYDKIEYLGEESKKQREMIIKLAKQMKTLTDLLSGEDDEREETIQ